MGNREKLLRIITVFCGNNQSEFARKVGLAQSTVSGWLQRGTIDYERVAQCFPNISAEWLLRSEGPISRSEKPVAPFTGVSQVVDVNELQSLREENRLLRERCDRLTDRLLGIE